MDDSKSIRLTMDERIAIGSAFATRVAEDLHLAAWRDTMPPRHGETPEFNRERASAWRAAAERARAVVLKMAPCKVTGERWIAEAIEKAERDRAEREKRSAVA